MWKDLEFPISPDIQRSTVTQFLDVEGGIWKEYNGLRLTMRQAESIISANKDICAVQNADGVIYDQICYHSTREATGWMQHLFKTEKPKHLPNYIQKAIYEIQQSLHQIDKTLDEIRTNAKDSL